MTHNLENDYDVAILGAGFSGIATAHALKSRRYRIALIDRRTTYPDLFRAEKIEHDQADLMRKLGILDLRAPKNKPIGNIHNYINGHEELLDTVEQYGISYCETVNNMAANLPNGVEFINNKVESVDNGVKSQKIVFSDQSSISATVVVIATGGNDALLRSLDIERLYDWDLRSLSFGFDIKRIDDSDFQFSGFNYHIDPSETGVDYITLFPIGNRMRVNLFTQLEAKDPLVKRLRNDTINELKLLFPDITKYTGDIEICSQVQAMPTHFYVLKNFVQQGVVIIGDEFQWVSPTTGTGLSKILNDVDTLTNNHLPQWISSRNVDKSAIARYYQDTQKKESDRKSLSMWIHYQNKLYKNKKSIFKRIKHRLLLNRQLLPLILKTK